MKIRRVMTIMLLVASVSLVGACATSKTYPPQPVAVTSSATQTSGLEKTTTSMQAVERDMKAMATQINSTNAALNEVILAKGTPGVKSAFDTYSANVAQTEKAAAAFVKNSDQMTARGTDYFEEWNKELSKSGTIYTNPQIQQLSEQRRAALGTTFKQIADSSASVKAQVNSYLSEINQIKAYFSRDLSGAGIDTIGPVAQKTINDGQQILNQVQPIMTAAEQARSELGATGSAAGGVYSPKM